MATLMRNGIGTWKTGAHWVMVEPRLADTRPGVIFSPGGGGAGATSLVTPNNEIRSLIFAVAEYYPVLAIDDAGMAFANASDIADMTAALNFLHNQPGVDSGPVGCIAVSQGNTVAMNYYRDFPGTISCVAGIIPLVDMEDVRTNDNEGFRDEIDSAWGVTYPTPLPEGANPADDPPLGLPWQAWYSAWDNIVTEQTVLNMATVLDAEAINVGDNGHSPLTVAAVDSKQMIRFLKENI